MSVPATPPPVRRPAAAVAPAPAAAVAPAPAARTPEARPVPSPQAVQLREGLRQVLGELRFPARRWEVIAEADSWGVGGPLRQAIGRLPDGNYTSLQVVLDVLTGPAGRTAPDPGHATVPGRVVVPMRAPTNGPRRP